MVIRSDERPVSVKEHMRDGAGQVKMCPIMSAEQLRSAGKLFNTVTLEKGCEVGYHMHVGDCEAYLFLSGEGELNDNGTVTTVRAGDVSFTEDGEGHSLKNNCDEPLVFIALVLNR